MNLLNIDNYTCVHIIIMLVNFIYLLLLFNYLRLKKRINELQLAFHRCQYLIADLNIELSKIKSLINNKDDKKFESCKTIVVNKLDEVLNYPKSTDNK